MGEAGVRAPATVRAATSEVCRGERLTLQGVLGIVRTTFVAGGTIAWSWVMVTPARMLRRSFPSRASFIPGSLRIALASWGLQLSR